MEGKLIDLDESMKCETKIYETPKTCNKTTKFHDDNCATGQLIDITQPFSTSKPPILGRTNYVLPEEGSPDFSPMDKIRENEFNDDDDKENNNPLNKFEQVQIFTEAEKIARQIIMSPKSTISYNNNNRRQSYRRDSLSLAPENYVDIAKAVTSTPVEKVAVPLNRHFGPQRTSECMGGGSPNLFLKSASTIYNDSCSRTRQSIESYNDRARKKTTLFGKKSSVAINAFKNDKPMALANNVIKNDFMQPISTSKKKLSDFRNGIKVTPGELTNSKALTVFDHAKNGEVEKANSSKLSKLNKSKGTNAASLQCQENDTNSAHVMNQQNLILKRMHQNFPGISATTGNGGVRKAINTFESQHQQQMKGSTLIKLPAKQNNSPSPIGSMATNKIRTVYDNRDINTNHQTITNKIGSGLKPLGLKPNSINRVQQRKPSTSSLTSIALTGNTEKVGNRAPSGIAGCPPTGQKKRLLSETRSPLSNRNDINPSKNLIRGVNKNQGNNMAIEGSQHNLNEITSGDVKNKIQGGERLYAKNKFLTKVQAREFQIDDNNGNNQFKYAGSINGNNNENINKKFLSGSRSCEKLSHHRITALATGSSSVATTKSVTSKCGNKSGLSIKSCISSKSGNFNKTGTSRVPTKSIESVLVIGNRKMSSVTPGTVKSAAAGLAKTKQLTKVTRSIKV